MTIHEKISDGAAGEPTQTAERKLNREHVRDKTTFPGKNGQLLVEAGIEFSERWMC
jgi:hypothetical protein